MMVKSHHSNIYIKYITENVIIKCHFINIICRANGNVKSPPTVYGQNIHTPNHCITQPGAINMNDALVNLPTVAPFTNMD